MFAQLMKGRHSLYGIPRDHARPTRLNVGSFHAKIMSLYSLHSSSIANLYHFQALGGRGADVGCARYGSYQVTVTTSPNES